MPNGDKMRILRINKTKKIDKSYAKNRALEYQSEKNLHDYILIDIIETSRYFEARWRKL